MKPLKPVAPKPPKVPDVPSMWDSMMNDLFGKHAGLFKTSKTEVTTTQTSSSSSALNWRTTSDDSTMTLEVDLPGIDPKCISLSIMDGRLVVEGERAGKGFTQRFTIAHSYDLKTAKATLANGQLRVKLDRAAATNAVQIPIDVK